MSGKCREFYFGGLVGTLNYYNASICQNRRKNCLCKSFWFLVCIANVTNCEPDQLLLGGQQEVCTTQEIVGYQSHYLYMYTEVQSLLVNGEVPIMRYYMLTRLTMVTVGRQSTVVE